MIVLVVLNIILGGSYISTSNSLFLDLEALVDGISTTFTTSSGTIVFGIDEFEGMIISLSAIIAIATAFGINVFGSGLNETSVRTITIVSIYTGIWIILSIIVHNLIVMIEFFGSLLYILITIAYTIGVIQKVVEG